MISISLVRGQHECTKGPTQPPDAARWIWYKKTDSRTVISEFGLYENQSKSIIYQV